MKKRTAATATVTDPQKAVVITLQDHAYTCREGHVTESNLPGDFISVRFSGGYIGIFQVDDFAWTQPVLEATP